MLDVVAVMAIVLSVVLVLCSYFLSEQPSSRQR
jgi:hypothetical protein